MFINKFRTNKINPNLFNQKLANLKFGIFFKNFSVIGLDMGGTNTCIAVLEPNGPRVIENAEGLRTTPSCVSIAEDGAEFVAVAGKRISIQNLHNSFYGTKFFFGRKFSDKFVQDLLKRFPFKIEKGPNDEVFFLTDQAKHYTPKTISILYLKYVRDQAEALTGKPVKKVVMSLPRFINEEGQNELKETVKECGMDVVKFIEEPKAAAIAYNLDKNEKVNKILIFNFGGLNFSLTYLEKIAKTDSAAGVEKADTATAPTDGKTENLKNSQNSEKNVIPETKNTPSEEEEEKDIFDIKAESFDYYLGGEDIDTAITQFLLNEFERINKMDISKDLYALQRVRDAADKVKVELSLSQQAEISLPFLAADQTGPKHLNMRISRSKFETLIDPIISKLKQNCENFLKENKIEKNQIDDILLVGGCSRIPRVQEIVKLIFGKEANKSLNPEEVPAMGASILAAKIKLKIEEIKSLDKLPLSIGIETLGGNFARLIPKDTILPLKITKTFTTVFDNQPKVDLKFYFGEREIAAENKLLGSLSMVVPLTKKGETRVNVTFNINNKGDMSVSAVEELSKKVTNYSTKINTGLTQEIIEDVLEVSSKLKEADKAKQDLILVKVEADNFIYNLEKLIKENKSNMDDLDDDKKEEIEKVENDVNNLNELLKGEDFENIITSYQNLQKDCEKIENLFNLNLNPNVNKKQA
jgi:molecular chaperone DnaK